jgi:hypothetical protein
MSEQPVVEPTAQGGLVVLRTWVRKNNSSCDRQLC